MAYPTFNNTIDTEWKRTESGSAVSALDCDVPTGVAAGKLIVAVFMCDVTGGGTPTFDTPSGFTSHINSWSANGLIGIFEKNSADGSETTVSATLSSSSGGIIGYVYVISGHLLTQAVIGAAVQDQGGGSDWLSPTITTTADESLLFVGGMSPDNSSWTSGDEPNDTTLVHQSTGFSMWGGVAYEQFAINGSTAGNENNQWTNQANVKRSFAFAISPTAGTLAPVILATSNSSASSSLSARG